MKPTTSHREVLAAAGAGAVYAVLATATLYLTRNGDGIATIWPSNAILLAIIWTLPKRRWAPYLIAGWTGNAVAGLLFGNPVLASLPFGLANMAEVAIAAHLLRRTHDSREAFGSLTQVARFGMIAGVIAPAISALPGAMTAQQFYGSNLMQAYASWFGADALGLLIVTPAVLMLRCGELKRWYEDLNTQSRAQLAVLFGAVAISAAVVFGQSRYPALFLLFGPTILAACRLGRVGAVLSVMIVAIAGSVAVLSGAGPISLIQSDNWTHIMVFQIFLAVLLMTALPAAAELDKRNMLNARLAEREAALLLLMDQSSDLILNFDISGRCVFASGSGASLAAYTPAILKDANVVDLPHPQDAAIAKANHDQALAQPGAEHRCEYRMSDREGNWFWVEASTRGLTDANGLIVGTVSALRDVSHHKRREADLRTAATTDQLTGAANREGFFKAFESATRDADLGPCWLGLLDIDHFKGINDRYGHLVGDEVLRKVTRLLRAQLRGGDLLGRIGGEEFAVLLVGCDEHTASQMLERLRIAVAHEGVAVDNARMPISVTLSAGFVLVPDGHDRDDIFAAADEALYFSKRSGRNRVTQGIGNISGIAA